MSRTKCKISFVGFLQQKGNIKGFWRSSGQESACQWRGIIQSLVQEDLMPGSNCLNDQSWLEPALRSVRNKRSKTMMRSLNTTIRERPTIAIRINKIFKVY